MTGQDKNKINIRELSLKAKNNDKGFLYYDNSKSKINSIIRKNKLPDYINEFLWQSKIYIKEIVKHQTLSEFIRKDLIDNCIQYYPDSPWVSTLRNFIKLHNPTEEEIQQLFTCQHNNIILECWELKPLVCYRAGTQQRLYDMIKNSPAYRNEYVSKRINSVVIKVFENIEEMQIPLLNSIVDIGNGYVTQSILIPLMKVVKMKDDAVDFLIKNLDANHFAMIMKNAIHRENISDNMIAKIYLTMDEVK